MNRRDSNIKQQLKCRVCSIHTNKRRCACFKTTRASSIGRVKDIKFCLTFLAKPTCMSRLYLFSELFLHIKKRYTWYPQHVFACDSSEHVDIHLFHINWDMTC